MEEFQGLRHGILLQICERTRKKPPMERSYDAFENFLKWIFLVSIVVRIRYFENRVKTLSSEPQSETPLCPFSFVSAPDFPFRGRDFSAKKSLINPPVADGRRPGRATRRLKGDLFAFRIGIQVIRG